MSHFKEMSVVEAIVAVLVENGIQYAFGIGGHGNTPLLEALIPYHQEGRLRVVEVHHEAVAAHAATALKWTYGVESIVFTSIGPGWFNTLLAQNTAMSDGYGFLVFAGDKTTAYEGPNMQQIVHGGQFGFFQAAEAISKKAYTIIDPRNVYTVLPEAIAKTRELGSAGPVNIFLPMNLQASAHNYNLEMLLRPVPAEPARLRADPREIKRAAEEIRRYRRIALRVGGGAVGAGAEIKALAARIGAAVVMGPVASDVVESDFVWNVGPGGSKGSISGNFASENAELIINVGGRGVCQADCSGTLYARAKQFININLNPIDAVRYSGIPVVGDAAAVLRDLLAELNGGSEIKPDPEWLADIIRAKSEWAAYLEDFYNHPLIDGRLTQPAAIKAIDDYINGYEGIKIYDAGDVQAHGFQIARHVKPKTFLTDTGNSCMGFGICAAFGLGLMKDGRYPTAVIGDGSFLMQAQAIRDMVKHGSNCTVVVLDNQSMAAISALQQAQKYSRFATEDAVRTPPVDFAKLAESMGCVGLRPEASINSLIDCVDRAHRHDGPAVVDVKVAPSLEGHSALGAFGRWNVGPWSATVESIWEGKG
jgi:3D-(3,5/4)-trihydroxycyclohexane-1,2-dione acylhydrolase (decyclizing)